MRDQGRRRNRSEPPRPSLNLKESYHSCTTVAGRKKARQLLEEWLAEQGLSALSILLRDIRQSNEALAEFVQFCYDPEVADGLCIDALLSIHDEFYEYAKLLTLPWRREPHGSADDPRS